jgi:hypothetical protein
MHKFVWTDNNYGVVDDLGDGSKSFSLFGKIVQEEGVWKATFYPEEFLGVGYNWKEKDFNSLDGAKKWIEKEVEDHVKYDWMDELISDFKVVGDRII